MACYQIFAFFHFEGLFHFFCEGIPSRRRSLCLSSSSSFFSASKARPLSLAAIVFRTAFVSWLGLAFAPDRLSSIRFFRRRRCRKISLPRFGFAVWLFFVGSKSLRVRGGCILFRKSRKVFQDVLQPFRPPKTSVVSLPFQHHPLAACIRECPSCFLGIARFKRFLCWKGVFRRQSVFLLFLCDSAYAFPLVCPFPRSLCGASRPLSNAPWRAVSLLSS